jgi:transposase
MTAPETALQRDLYMSLELSDKHWKLTFGNGNHGPSRCTVAAGDIAAVLQRIAKAKLRFGLSDSAPVHSCYEAGRDGWWLHRALREQGVDNIVVDSASIEVNRRSRRVKTDRLDGDKLLSMLQRWSAGETRVWAVVLEHTVQQEDDRRVHRELQRLSGEHTAHANRIGSLLVLHNLRVRRVGGRDWGRWWTSHREQVPSALRDEIEREQARLVLVKQQMRELQAVQTKQLGDHEQPQVAQLARLRSIGITTAWVLVKELFGWRRFANRREVAGCLGLVPTPYASGDTQMERGISKAGNKRARTLLVELAWSWLRYQPHSDLSQWFNRRFGLGGKRMRRIGIVALARRLGVALWRYLEHGEVPTGASLKPLA